MAKLPPGLVRRGDTYYYRRRAPVELRPLFKNGEIPMKSLGTKDRAVAEERWKLERDYWDAEFKRLKASLTPTLSTVPDPATEPHLPPPPAQPGFRYRSPHNQMRQARHAGGAKHLPPLNSRIIDSLVTEWRTTKIEGCLSTPLSSPSEDALGELQHDLWSFTNNDPHASASVMNVADTLLHHHGLAGVPGEPMYLRLCEHLRLAWLDVLRLRLARMKGEDIRPLLHVGPAQPVYGQAAQPAITPTVREAKERYWAEEVSQRKDLRKRSLDKALTGLNLIVEFFPPETMIGDLDMEQCDAFQKFLRKLPPNFTKIRRGRSLIALAEEAAASNTPGLKRATRESYFAQLRQLLNWAKLKKFTADNPARDIKEGRMAKGDKIRRRTFTTMQLRQIFNAPLYIGCQDDEAGFNTPGPNHPRRGRFWLPLLGLFSGARAGELCQLRVADVCETEELKVPFIRLDDEEGDAGGDDDEIDNGVEQEKSLKNENSFRAIPIHPELVRIGFLEFVSAKRAAGEELLFPEMLVENVQDNASYRFSKLFGTFLLALKIKRTGLSYHSFRHTFRDVLRNNDVDREKAETLGGWIKDNRTSSQYGEGFAVEKLYETLRETSYRGLDLSHLYPKLG